jgi:hypothetical protein
MKRYKIDITNLEEENIPKDQYLEIFKYFNHNLDDNMPIGLESLDNMPVVIVITRLK